MSIDIPGVPKALRSSDLDRVIRLRRTLAHQIDCLLSDVDHPRRARGPRTLVRRDIAQAVRPSLLNIAAMLRDDHRHETLEAVEELHQLLRDGADSPLYGGNVAAAVLAVATIESRLRPPREHELPAARVLVAQR